MATKKKNEDLIYILPVENHYESLTGEDSKAMTWQWNLVSDEELPPVALSSAANLLNKYIYEKAFIDMTEIGYRNSLPPLHRLAFPMETPEAYKFWGSRHRCNRAKAIMAFSRDEAEAHRLMRRFTDWHFEFRERVIKKYAAYMTYPDMKDIPFTPMGIPWWVCLSGPPDEHSKVYLKWEDAEKWMDNEKWVEWVDRKTYEEIVK